MRRRESSSFLLLSAGGIRGREGGREGNMARLAYVVRFLRCDSVLVGFTTASPAGALGVLPLPLVTIP